MIKITDFVKQSAELELMGPPDETGNRTSLGVKLKLQGTTNQSIKQKFIEANGWLTSAGKTEDPKKFTEAVMKADKIAIDIAAESVIGWDNDDFMGGTYTPQYARELLSKPELEFIRVQINQFVADQQNWFRKGPSVAN